MSKVISAKVEPTMKAKIELIAKKNMISTADQIRVFMMYGIQKWEKEFGVISQDEINQLLLFPDKE